MIRIAPGIPMEAFERLADVAPVAELAASEKETLRKAVGAGVAERVVLVAFGGLALDSLPYDRLDRMDGYRFVVSGFVPAGTAQLQTAESIPLAFNQLLASADIIVTKPGYATTVEAVAHGTPVVYVRRYNFADEAVLVDYLNRHGRGVELSAEDFSEGRWQGALAAAETVRQKSAPPIPCGAAEAAEMLAKYL